MSANSTQGEAVEHKPGLPEIPVRAENGDHQENASTTKTIATVRTIAAGKAAVIFHVDVGQGQCRQISRPGDKSESAAGRDSPR